MTTPDRTPVAVYADGGVILRNPSPHGGTLAWCHVNAAGERIATGRSTLFPATGKVITNNVTEMLALLRAFETLPFGWAGTVYSDSQITLGRLFCGWKWTGIAPHWIAKAKHELQRLDLANIKHVLLDGHPTRAQLAAGIGKRGHPVSEHNVWCDQQCQDLAQRWRAQNFHALVSQQGT